MATKYQELKRAVLEFANNTAVNAATVISKADGPSPMQIGQCSSGHSQSWTEMASHATEIPAEEDWEHVADLGAVSITTQCHNCGGFGHIAPKCPSPRMGKGGKSGKGGKGDASPKGGVKGGGKGAQKGGGKGPMGGCWTCGGAHYANECTASLGKGGSRDNYAIWNSFQ